ncbi:MAG: HAD family hydrolase [Longimicrobiales bacterium]
MSGRVDFVFVDFDDTIVDTSPRFTGARRRLFEVLAQAGFTAEEAERLHHDEIDPIMRAQYGFGPHRLEHAFRETYERLRQRAGHAMDHGIAESCAALGRTVAGTPPAFEGALDALRRLANVHPTALYTQSGDADYQMACVREAGILDVLPATHIRIAAHKGVEDFRAAIDAFGISEPERVWMVGNSMRCDVNPALEAGANAILVETADPWHYDVVAPAGSHYHTAPSFAAAVDMLVKL